jgi:hypothetical protein
MVFLEPYCVWPTAPYTLPTLLQRLHVQWQNLNKMDASLILLTSTQALGQSLVSSSTLTSRAAILPHGCR